MQIRKATKKAKITGNKKTTQQAHITAKVHKYFKEYKMVLRNLSK